MRIFWLNGNITIEPNTAEERRALRFLIKSAKFTSLREMDAETRAVRWTAEDRDAWEEKHAAEALQTASMPTQEVAGLTV
jgi:hypothetical protein